MSTTFGMHETLELHEIAAFKTVSMTKSKIMQVLISDPDLKQILQQDAQLSTMHLEELQALLTKRNS
jgi:ubiquinone biosynthesis protein Coq4